MALPMPMCREKGKADQIVVACQDSRHLLQDGYEVGAGQSGLEAADKRVSGLRSNLVKSMND